MPKEMSINYNCHMDRQSGAFDIQAYMTRGVERVVADAVRATLKNPKESIFMAKFAAASRRASARRREAEEKGEHIPAFLIASITSQCNLTAPAAIPGVITRPRMRARLIFLTKMIGIRYSMKPMNWVSASYFLLAASLCFGMML